MKDDCSSRLARDIDDVTIVIKTFERPLVLEACLQSLRLFYPNVPVIIIDDSRHPLPPSMFDRQMRYLHTEFDIGLSEGRNRAVELVETKLVFIMDDDFMFGPSSRLDLLAAPVLLGLFEICGSRMINFGTEEIIFQGSMSLEGKTLQMHMEKNLGYKEGYSIFDYCHNIFMSRTDFLRKYRWDENLKMGEHAEFFLRIFKDSPGQVTMIPEASFDHYPLKEKTYKKFRKRASKYENMVLVKHDLEKIETIKSPRQKILDMSKKRNRIIPRLMSIIGLTR